MNNYFFDEKRDTRTALLIAYRKARNQIRKETRNKAINKQYNIALNIKSNPTKFCNYVRSKSKQKSAIGEIKYKVHGENNSGMYSTLGRNASLCSRRYGIDISNIGRDFISHKYFFDCYTYCLNEQARNRASVLFEFFMICDGVFWFSDNILSYDYYYYYY